MATTIITVQFVPQLRNHEFNQRQNKQQSIDVEYQARCWLLHFSDVVVAGENPFRPGIRAWIGLVSRMRWHDRNATIDRSNSYIIVHLKYLLLSVVNMVGLHLLYGSTYEETVEIGDL